MRFVKLFLLGSFRSSIQSRDLVLRRSIKSSSNMSSLQAMQRVLDFWFPTGANQKELFGMENFAQDWQLAMNGGYSDWETSSKGCLALVVILDQFSRNMFRGNSGSFASDDKALQATRLAIEKGWDLELTEMERQILYMPLMHSESLEVHETLSLPKFNSSQYAVMHADIIRKFGRYPHRNAILGRESTPEEAEFLTQPGSSF